MNVTKRDGRIAEFDGNKIKSAVLSAFNDVDGDITYKDKNIANKIVDYIESLNKDMSVEEIQDIVEIQLMKSKRKDVAKSYIIYRNDRSRVRQNKSKLMQSVKEKLCASNVLNQNANVDEHSFGGRMGEANEAVTKDYALNNLISDMARNNHLNNEIYIHDLGHYAIGDHNCESLPFDDLLANGFNTRQTDVRPANSVSTALQLVAVLFQLQSLMQFGGVSATHLDWTMVPYVRKSFYKHWKDGCKYILNIDVSKYDDVITNQISIDDESYKTFDKAYEYAINMTEKEVKQAVEGLYHNLNTLQSRSGNQLEMMVAG